MVIICRVLGLLSGRSSSRLITAQAHRLFKPCTRCISSVAQRNRTGLFEKSKYQSFSWYSDTASFKLTPDSSIKQHDQGYLNTPIVSGLDESVARRIFLPVGYPNSVSDSYTDFILLNAGQVVFIALSRVLCTQAMLLAVGLGHGALPVAAVTTWLLKDGLGHLGSILVGTSINNRFDSDPKKYKFMSVSLGQVANLLGILSLSQPGMFLIFTSLSSALSRVGTLAFTASRAKIYENFAMASNLGDLMRCSQAQSTLGTLLGTAIGIGLSPLVGSDLASILTAFVPISATTHLLAYKAISKIELKTLNQQRFQLVMDEWVQNSTIPSIHNVALREQFVYYPKFLAKTSSINVNPPITPTILSNAMLANLSVHGYHLVQDAAVVQVYIAAHASNIQVVKGLYEAHNLVRNREIAGFESFESNLKTQGWDLSAIYLDDVDYRIHVS
jgi:hypothetical protein